MQGKSFRVHLIFFPPRPLCNKSGYTPVRDFTRGSTLFENPNAILENHGSASRYEDDRDWSMAVDVK